MLEKFKLVDSKEPNDKFNGTGVQKGIPKRAKMG